MLAVTFGKVFNVAGTVVLELYRIFRMSDVQAERGEAYPDSDLFVSHAGLPSKVVSFSVRRRGVGEKGSTEDVFGVRLSRKSEIC